MGRPNATVRKGGPVLRFFIASSSPFLLVLVGVGQIDRNGLQERRETTNQDQDDAGKHEPPFDDLVFFGVKEQHARVHLVEEVTNHHPDGDDPDPDPHADTLQEQAHTAPPWLQLATLEYIIFREVCQEDNIYLL